MSLIDLTPAQLRRAANLKEQIAGLEKQLVALIGSGAVPTLVSAQPATKKKGGMSAAGKAQIIAAQKRRWAKVRAAKAAKN